MTARASRVVRELVLVVLGYGIYSIIRNYVGSADNYNDARRATANSLRIVNLERSLGLFQEGRLQHVALRMPWLVRALDSFWSYGYLVVTAAVVVWVIRRHPGSYAALRNGFVVATVVGLFVFALYPTVPPRLLPRSYGLVDTWVRLGGIAATKAPRIERISDPFASMPSFHVAWATWSAVAVSRVVRARWARRLAWAYFGLTVLAVLVTGNHFVLDCVAGAGLMLVALRVPLPSWDSRYIPGGLPRRRRIGQPG